MLTKKKLMGTALSVLMAASLALAPALDSKAANWAKDSAGWWWQEDNGSYPTSQWKMINGSWYWFNGSGYMATGWVHTGGSWYFMYGSGAMATGWVNIGERWYYMYGSGAMATGWVYDGGTWYYMYGSGAMATGWVNIGERWYYMYGSGAMAHDCWIGNYYVGSSGAMYVNSQTPDGYYVGADGAWIPNGGSESNNPQEKDTFNIGETWEVPGQWKVTVNSVSETSYRNPYSDRNPGAVYIINYTYENIGYDHEYLDGLYIDFESGQIVDSSGVMGYSYPAMISLYPDFVPVGARITAESAIGVDNPGNFTIKMGKYDSTSTKQEATFNFVVK